MLLRHCCWCGRGFSLLDFFNCCWMRRHTKWPTFLRYWSVSHFYNPACRFTLPLPCLVSHFSFLYFKRSTGHHRADLSALVHANHFASNNILQGGKCKQSRSWSCSAGKQDEDDISNEYRIKQKILRHYDRTSRPVRNDSTPVNVLIAVSLSHILDTVCIASRALCNLFNSYIPWVAR